MINDSQKIAVTTLRETVEILLPDGRVYSGPRNIPVGDFLRQLPEWSDPQIVGAIINGELRELTYPVAMDAKVQPLSMSTPDGARIYRRSLTYLLVAAFESLFPNASLDVDHSVSSGGYYCTVRGVNPIDQKFLDQLSAKMKAMVDADLPIQKRIVPKTEAMEMFARKGYDDKVRLLKYRQKDTLVLYRVGDYQDYLHGYMVPRSEEHTSELQ